MSCNIYYRIVGYVFTLVMHITNLRVMRSYITEETMKDPHVLIFSGMQNRFFTSWTFFLQIIYAVLGIICDVMLLLNRNKKNYKLPKLMSSSREIMFSGLVWPCTLVVFSVFWTVYLYDKKLIFPDFLEKIIPPVSNHIIHTVILPVVLWEVAFRPRPQPKSHRRHIAQLILHLLAYFAVLVYTYIDRGFWLYPLFAVQDGTTHLVLLFLFLVALFIGWYYTQWVLTYLVHGSVKTSKQKVK